MQYKIYMPSFSLYAIEFHSLICYIISRLSFETITCGKDMVSRALLKYNTQQKHPATAHCGVFLYAFCAVPAHNALLCGILVRELAVTPLDVVEELAVLRIHGRNAGQIVIGKFILHGAPFPLSLPYFIAATSSSFGMRQSMPLMCP